MSKTGAASGWLIAVHVRFEQRGLPGLDPADRILLILPRGDLRVRREDLRSSDPARRMLFDDGLVAAAEHVRDVRVTVFCGQAPAPTAPEPEREGAGSWRFDEDLDREQAYALAKEIVVSQLPSYRRLFLAGVCMHVRVEMGPREQLAFRRAIHDLRVELEHTAERLEGKAREIAELDAWLLRNFVFVFAISLDRLLTSTLGGNAHAVQQRMRHAERRKNALSAELREQTRPEALNQSISEPVGG